MALRADERAALSDVTESVDSPSVARALWAVAKMAAESPKTSNKEYILIFIEVGYFSGFSRVWTNSNVLSNDNANATFVPISF